MATNLGQGYYWRPFRSLFIFRIIVEAVDVLKISTRTSCPNYGPKSAIKIKAITSPETYVLGSCCRYFYVFVFGPNWWCSKRKSRIIEPGSDAEPTVCEDFDANAKVRETWLTATGAIIKIRFVFARQVLLYMGDLRHYFVSISHKGE